MIMSDDNNRSSLGQLNDPEVKILPGKALISHLEDLSESKRWKGKDTLTVENIKEIKNLLKEGRKNEKTEEGVTKKKYLNELFSDSEVIIPSLEIPKRNPELEKRLNELRRKLEDKEYQRMTKNVSTGTNKSQSHPEDSIGYQMKQMNQAIIAVIQFVISLAAAFLFGFTGIEIFVGPLDLAVRLLLGIAAAVIVGVAELYILVVNLDAREGAHEKIE